MAKYLGPRLRVSRRLKEPIFGQHPTLEKKNYPPGMHGKTKKSKQSEYAVQLVEKQKAKYTYGLLERQFRIFFTKASRMKGMTGANLLKLLESRLDNTVYRLGIGSTRRASKQLVSHRHILVNGAVVNIPSYILKSGDVVTVRERSKALEAINNSVNVNAPGNKFPWLSWDHEKYQGTFLMSPEREMIPETIKEHLIVELYSK